MASHINDTRDVSRFCVNYAMKSGAFKTKSPFHTTMTADQWIAVPGIDIQRDTITRAATAAHLHEFSVTHFDVSMAVLPGGDIVKLEGHTRAEVWDSVAPSAKPSTNLLVTVYPCLDMDEARARYREFNNAKTMKTQRDQAFGAARRGEYAWTSGYMKTSTPITAIKMVYLAALGGYWHASKASSIDAEEATYFLLDTLKDLDALLDGRSKHSMKTPMTAAFLILLRTKNRDTAKRFIRAVLDGGGNKSGNDRDGVQWAVEFRNGYKPGRKTSRREAEEKKRSSPKDSDTTVGLVKDYITAFQMYQKQQMLSKFHRRCDDYVRYLKENS